MISFFSDIPWAPGIGDPTFIGWFTAVAYFITGFLCIACARQIGTGISVENVTLQYRLWWFIAIVLLLLGINKQLDLQTLITEIGKVVAKRQGWYEQRRIVQALFIAGIVCGGFFSLLLIGRAFQNVWKENRLALGGLVALMSFICIRAISFHGIDRMLGLKLSGFELNGVLELGGITCIWFSAVLTLKKTAGKTVRLETKRQVNYL